MVDTIHRAEEHFAEPSGGNPKERAVIKHIALAVIEKAQPPVFARTRVALEFALLLCPGHEHDFRYGDRVIHVVEMCLAAQLAARRPELSRAAPLIRGNYATFGP